MNTSSLPRVIIALLACAVVGLRVNAASSGTVVAWGDNSSGQCNVPAGLSGVTAIAAGYDHLVALRNDGTLVAWGNNAYGQTAVPSDLENVIAVAAGGNNSAALKSDGTLVIWGANGSGQRIAPANLSGVTAIGLGVVNTNEDQGLGFAAALKGDGTVVAWGLNDAGQASVPAGLRGVTAISVGSHVLALRNDGTVVAWGRNISGQTNVPRSLDGVVAVAATNGGHSLVLRQDGTLVGWGNNNFGQIDPLPGLSGLMAIAVGGQNSAAIKSDGTLVVWGQSREGQLAIPAGLSGVTAITVGRGFVAALVGTGGNAPVIVAQPQTLVVSSNSTTVLNVSSTGTGPLRYQWSKDGASIAGATAATLVLNNVQPSQAGNYSVMVANSYGSTTSTTATLTISTNTSDPGRLINLSILTPLAPNETMTMGTVLGGAGTSGSKPLLARAAGPSLAPLGVTGFLPDPTMTLINASAGTTVTTNNDWAGTTALSNAFAVVGAFAYVNPTSKDAAIFQPSLAPGGYTVQVSDAGTGSGTVIAELYDASGNGNTAITPRLINVSVLKQIATGASLTAGFVVGGSTAKTVLVRAVGPTLGSAPFSLGGTMPDPQLKLFNAAGVTIATNDDWGGDTQIANAASRVGAFALSAPSSKDAVLLLTLGPGSYTAQVSPTSGTTGGTVITEVYEMP